MACRISTNLNVMRDAEALLRAAPDHLLISVSGFHQDTYAVTHTGGDIEVVKEHMRALAQPELALAEVTDADRSIISRLAMPLREAVQLASKTPAASCTLQDTAVVLDVKGNVYLCCEAAMDASRNQIASFLDTTIAAVQTRKKNHALCTTCMAYGMPPAPVTTTSAG
jgi:hypothetical protein